MVSSALDLANWVLAYKGGGVGEDTRKKLDAIELILRRHARLTDTTPLDLAWLDDEKIVQIENEGHEQIQIGWENDVTKNVFCVNVCIRHGEASISGYDSKNRKSRKYYVMLPNEIKTLGQLRSLIEAVGLDSDRIGG